MFLGLAAGINGEGEGEGEGEGKRWRLVW